MTAIAQVGTRRPHVAEIVAWGAGASAVAALAVTVAAEPVDLLDGHILEDVATALMWAFLAGLLARHGRHPARRLFLVVACCAAVSVAGSAYAALDATAAIRASWMAGWIWTVSTFVPVTLQPATFGAGSGWSRGRRMLVTISVAALAAMSAGLATSSQIDLTAHHRVPNPLASPASDALFLAGSVLVVITALASIGTLWRRTARSGGEERRGLATVAVAATVTLPALLTSLALPGWGPVIQLAVAPLVPGAVTLAILRHHLYDVEVVVRRSLVFAGLTVLVVGGYVLVVQAVAELLHRTPGTFESVVAAAAVALTFAPARSALQASAGRWVYGDRDTPERAIDDVGASLAAAADPTLALQSATDRVRSALRLAWVEVRPVAGPPVRSGIRPRWASDDLVELIDLTHLGIYQGALVLVPRGPRDPLDSRDRALVGQLATLVGAVLAGRRLLEDVRRSREDVVLAREEERRRVRRDLHDGLGPLLSALSTHTDVAAMRLRREPRSIEELLIRIREIADDAVTGLRRVVDDLQPAAVDELGLLCALQELAATLSTDRTTVTVLGETCTGLPAAVEVAAYRIVAEAVHNAVRHARARRVLVRLGRGVGHLHVEVADEGTGIPADAVPGVGLASMRQRAEELGATFSLTTGGSGTVVHVRFEARR